MLIQERKIVSVLFADVRGSLRLISGKDPEDVSQMLDPIVEIMVTGTRRRSGTIVQVRGDGILAVFGAPLSQEDHAKRACEAALWIQSALHSQSEQALAPATDDIAVRIGIHSGEVLFRASHEAGADWLEVTGDTVHIAARMEQTARPDSIQITPVTRRLAGPGIVVRSRGRLRVKGLAETTETFEVLAAEQLTGSGRDGATATPFINRVSERAALLAALQIAATGAGRAIAISGEPGCGKSRLTHEVAKDARRLGFTVLEIACTADESQTGYWLFRMLCRQILGLDTYGSDPQAAARSVFEAPGTHPALDVDRMALAIGALVDTGIAASAAWLAFGPDRRRSTILASLAALLGALGRSGAVMLAIEDLQWADQESIVALDHVLEAMPPRFVILLNFREEFAAKWAGTGRPVLHKALQTLDPDSGRELVATLLGPGRTGDRLVQFVSDRAAGNPFFAEELVADLAEQGFDAVEREPDGGPLAAPHYNLPMTIRAVLATRLDRLTQEEKALLEAAAAIGREFDLDLLATVARQPTATIEAILRHLIQSRFLGPPNGRRYAFQHALTREAAYFGMTTTRRRALHLTVLDALAARHGVSSRAFAETCLHHAIHAQSWLEAAGYARLAAANSMALSANRQAQAFLLQGLKALESVPHDRKRDELAADILIEMRDPLNRLGRLPEVAERLRAAQPITVRLNDRRRTGQLGVHLSHILWLTGKHGAAAEIAERAVTQGRDWDDEALGVRSGFQLGLTKLAQGELVAAAALMEETVTAIRSRPAITGRYGLDEAVAAVANGYAARAYADLGRWQQAEDAALASRWLPDALQRPFNRVFADLAAAYVALARGMHARALESGEQAVVLCIQAEASLMLPVAYALVGGARLAAGDHAQALEPLRNAVVSAAAMGFMFQHPWRLALLAEAELHMGQQEQALRLARQALRLSRRLGERPGEAFALRAVGLALNAAGTRDSARRHLRAAQSLAEAMQMHPLMERCRAELAAEGSPTTPYRVLT